MVIPTLIAVGISAILFARFEGDEGYGFQRKLAKVVLNTIACLVSIVSLTYVLR